MKNWINRLKFDLNLGGVMKKLLSVHIMVWLVVSKILSAQTERWVYTYDGTGNEDDVANSIVYGDGDLYTAGWTEGCNFEKHLTVISLTQDGNERWNYHYGGSSSSGSEAFSIVYGYDGNIYASGYIMTSLFHSYLTVISLDGDGNERWIYNLEGTSNYGYNHAYSIKMGQDGNVYTAGATFNDGTWTDFTVVSLTGSGNERWIYKYTAYPTADRARSFCFGENVNIYVCGTINNNFGVISLTNQGNVRWIYEHNSNVFDEALAITYGNDGNIYATGYVWNYGTKEDIAVISLTPYGQERWVYTYSGPGDSDDRALSITYGNDGNIYVAGFVTVDNDSTDLAVLSLTPSGNLRWIYIYNGSGNGNDRATSLAFGEDGNLYVAGYINSGCHGKDAVVISLDTSGNEKWIYTYNGQGNGFDKIKSIIYGEDGNLYTAGVSTGYDTNKDFTVISLEAGVSIKEDKFSYKKYNAFSSLFLDDMKFSNFEEGEIFIFSSSGKLVSRKALTTTSSSTFLKEIKKLPSGIYFIQFKKGNKIIKNKVMKR